MIRSCPDPAGLAMGPSAGCSRQAPVNFEPTAAMRAITRRLATFYPASPSRARKPGSRPPTLGYLLAYNCHPPSRGPEFGGACTSVALQPTTRSAACFAEKPTGTMYNPVNDIGSFSKVSPVSRAKMVAALPAATGVCRSTAHSTKQGGGERPRVSALSARESTTDHNNGPTGQREAAQAQAQTGVRSKPGQVICVPVSSIYTLGTASIREESINELFHVVIATAAARGAKVGDYGRAPPTWRSFQAGKRCRVAASLAPASPASVRRHAPRWTAQRAR